MQSPTYRQTGDQTYSPPTLVYCCVADHKCAAHRESEHMDSTFLGEPGNGHDELNEFVLLIKCFVQTFLPTSF